MTQFIKNKKTSFLIISVFISSFVLSQPYAPAAGEVGSTAISFDDSRFVAWATGIELTRGYVNIEDTLIEYDGTNRASFGTPEIALGAATNIATDAVSLGDSGIAILTFNKPITNGLDYDFAIFENGLNDNFLELAHVEVSSDGINFFRFPSHSATQTATPVGSFGSLNPTNLYNLAGKYRVGFGTPFDLEELKDEVGLDVEKITHIKIIDVVGTLGEKGTTDSFGNKINDLFPTPFNSGGFDLNAVGVIHEYNNLSLQKEHLDFSIYPNPSRGIIKLQWNNGSIEEIRVVNLLGKEIFKEKEINSSSFQLELQRGMYFLSVKSGNVVTKKVIIE